MNNLKSGRRFGDSFKQYMEVVSRAIKGEVIVFSKIEGSVTIIESKKFHEMSEKASKYDKLTHPQTIIN